MSAAALGPVHLSWLDVLLRLGSAAVFALAIGIERFVRRKPVDYRPFVIVSLASAALIVGLVEIRFVISDPRLSIDPGRVMSGVMTGVGFLGAGALFRERHIVQGAGSAAAIWAAGGHRHRLRARPHLARCDPRGDHPRPVPDRSGNDQSL